MAEPSATSWITNNCVGAAEPAQRSRAGAVARVVPVAVAVAVSSVLAALSTPVWAQTSAPLICQDGRVELILGGPVQPQDCKPKAARRRAAPATAVDDASAASAAASRRISERDQQRRDVDRRVILQRELQLEQEALAARLQPGRAEDPAAIARSRSNVAALLRELARLAP